MAGSIEKRDENTYKLIVSGGKNLDGSRCRKKTIHGTRKDAEIALAEFITEVNHRIVSEGTSITFDKWIDSNKLFIQANRKTIHPDTLGKWYKEHIVSLRLPVAKLHGIRHTNVTLLIFQNVYIATISARLGHVSINTTIKYYVHPLQNNMRKAAYVLQNLLINNNNN